MSARPLLIGSLAVALSAGSSFAAEKLPRVPPGFTIEKITTPELVKHPMMAGFDDRGRLFVACSAGKNLRAADLMKDPPNFIKMLEDTNGDGKFDKATVFADKMTLPMGALWYRGALYVASPPHIWKLEDTNGDGKADKRTILVDRFGFSGNAASVHGCFLGPTGRIYWCDGRHGHEFVDKQGKTTSKGKAARIFSCKPDGSDVRVHCGGGMDNPVEIDFTETGEMIGSVNLFYGRPRGDCLVHWVEGGVYPRFDQQQVISEFKRTGDLLGPITNFGHVAVSGMMRYRSGAFGPAGPEKVSGTFSRSRERRGKHDRREKVPDTFSAFSAPFTAGHIFTTQFNTHKVVYSVLKRSGSTFTSTEHEFLQSDDPDFHPTDVLEDADGSLLVIDTGGWFRIGCPVSKVAKPHITGAIYRIRRKGAKRKMTFDGIRFLLAAAGKPRRVATLLDHKNPFVRDRAIDVLAEIGKEAILPLRKIVLREVNRSELARRNAVWALSRMTVGNPHFYIAKALNDPAESVRLAAATAIDLRNLEVAAAGNAELRLREVAFNDTPAVRREAARALGRNLDGRKMERGTYEAAVYGIAKSLAKAGNDRLLEHSLIYALIQFRRPHLTTPLLKDKSPAVRRAALIALDQMDGGKLTRELVTPLLDTDDPALQKTALAVIAKHKGWAKETLSLVRKWLTADAKLTPDRTAMLRGFLVAQVGDTAVRLLVGELVQSPKIDTPKRLLLLEVMQRSPQKFTWGWAVAVKSLLTSDDAAVKLQAVRLVGERQLPFVTETQAIALNPKYSAELRAEALLAAGPKMRTISDDQLRFFAKHVDSNLPPLTRLTVARAIAAAPLSDRQRLLLRIPVDTADPLTLPVLLRAFEKSKSAEVGIALVKTLSEAKAVKSLSASELTRLFRKYPASVQSAAKPLLAKLGVNPAKQERRIVELLKLTDGGDSKRGRAIFTSKKAACAGCHTIAGQGGKVGPDLTTIGKIRQPRDFVEAIAFPSATIARGFRTYIVATDRGKVHTGVITRETSSEIVLRTAELAEIRLPRDRIEAIRESATSIMPKGLDKTLSGGEIRDLIAFLKSQK